MDYAAPYPARAFPCQRFAGILVQGAALHQAANQLDHGAVGRRLRLHGACHSCPHAMLTLKNGIEAEMRERLSPELTVERVMD